MQTLTLSANSRAHEINVYIAIDRQMWVDDVSIDIKFSTAP